MARITIERTNTWWDQAYIPIYINDKKVGAVGSGRTAEFNVADGTHKVVLKKKMIGYFKPLMIDLRKMKTKLSGCRALNMDGLSFHVYFCYCWASI